jgi:hypothetical protein
MDDELEGPILLDAEMLLAVDDAKKVGNIEPIRKSPRYRETLESMDKESGRTHEQNVRALDEFCRQAMMNTPALPAASREHLIQTLFKPDTNAH